MKKALLFAMTVAVGAGVFAAAPYVREVGKGGFKAITPRTAMSRAAKAPVMRAAEAPENAVETLPYKATFGKTDPEVAKF